MSRRLHKYKLLLDENLSPRTAFPRLNGLFDVKHVRDDFQRGGLSDPQVYDLAVAKQRVLVTYNVKHFQPLAGSKADAGIIGISANLPPSQIDTKLIALLTRSTSKRLAGTFTTLTGETEA